MLRFFVSNADMTETWTEVWDDEFAEAMEQHIVQLWIQGYLTQVI